MKNGKKILATMLAGLTASISAMGLVACQPDDNSSSAGSNQFRGVYEMYLVYAESQGIEPVSYEEWLASVKGEQGISVTDVKISYGVNKIGEPVMIFTFYMSDESTITEEVVIENTKETASEGLTYKISEDRLSYVVADSIACEDIDIVVPSTYNNKPVTAIDMIAFAQNTELKSVMIGKNVTTIGEMVFFGCSGLITVVIPDSVTSIGTDAFNYCTSLKNIVVSEDNAHYTSIDNDLYTKDGKTLVQYASGKTAKQFTIPETVTLIGEYAFTGCTNLTSVTIPNGVTAIGERAFADCSNLTSVVIGKDITSIEKYAFNNCKKLTNVYYQGTAEEWVKISIGSSNAYLTGATRYYYSETAPTTAGNHWHYDENGEVAVW